MSSETGSAGDGATRNVVWRQGRVKSDRMRKSIVVRVEHKVMHPVYKKYVKRYSTLLAHDEENTARVGDLVEVEFTRPISKRKRWRLRRVVERAVLPDAESMDAGTVEAGMIQAGLAGGAAGGAP